jgi:glycosyltransferase involved in cell wall biosynthesis
MKILFIHQNFPGQFKFLAPALAANPDNEVHALCRDTGLSSSWQGVKLHCYAPNRSSSVEIHPFAAETETKLIRADAVLQRAQAMRADGFVPDVIVAHPGWGESLFLKEIWPTAKLGIYCEFFYHTDGLDVGFDPEFGEVDLAERCRVQMKNLNMLMHMQVADAGIAPTHFQAQTYPIWFRDKIRVIHDGINTEQVRPNPKIQIKLTPHLQLTRNDEVITFVNRNLEPYRGYHSFMRALPEILRQRPRAHILIVGGDAVSYGAAPASGTSWKQIFLDEVRTQIADADLARVHFLGNLPYDYFIPLLQLSSVHVYLTYPFVLSWSLLEAMSAGCAIVASDTAPVREAIQDQQTGRLVDFFDTAQLASVVCELLTRPEERQRLGQNARQYAIDQYDIRAHCLPAQLTWVDDLAQSAV